MSITLKVITIFVVIAAVYVGLKLTADDGQLPDHFKDDHYWGAKPWKVGDPIPKDDPKINKFTINIPDEVISDLKLRLKQSRLTPSLPGVNFEYGFHSDYLKKVIDYWGTKYDWRKEEKALNKYPQFTTQIEGLTVHYYHIKPSVKALDTKPMIMVHGWPGSVVEFQKIIPLLTADSDLNFELIIPSIPGYGWSEASHKPGLNVIHVARIMSKLMTRLGHDKFIYHGGDWGSIIGQMLCNLLPNRVIGYHTTMPSSKLGPLAMVKLAVGSVCPSCVYDNPTVDMEKFYPVMDKIYLIIKETGYVHLQATRPDTVGAGLNDSPAGLAAYILEKFAVWTKFEKINQPDGGLTDRFTLDELLTNVMVYWVTNSITSSQRLYKETLNYDLMVKYDLQSISVPKEIPVGIAAPGNDLARLPLVILKETNPNIITFNDHLSVGHFGTFEDPKLMAVDIKSFVKAINNIKPKATGA